MMGALKIISKIVGTKNINTCRVGSIQVGGGGGGGGEGAKGA